MWHYSQWAASLGILWGHQQQGRQLRLQLLACGSEASGICIRCCCSTIDHEMGAVLLAHSIGIGISCSWHDTLPTVTLSRDIRVHTCMLCWRRRRSE